MSKMREMLCNNIENKIKEKEKKILELQNDIRELSNKLFIQQNRNSLYNIQLNNNVATITFYQCGVQLFLQLNANTNKNNTYFEIYQTNMACILNAPIEKNFMNGVLRIAPRDTKNIALFAINNVTISLYDIICDAIEEYRYVMNNNSAPSSVAYNLNNNGGVLTFLGTGSMFKM